MRVGFVELALLMLPLLVGVWSLASWVEYRWRRAQHPHNAASTQSTAPQKRLASWTLLALITGNTVMYLAHVSILAILSIHDSPLHRRLDESPQALRGQLDGPMVISFLLSLVFAVLAFALYHLTLRRDRHLRIEQETGRAPTAFATTHWLWRLLLVLSTVALGLSFYYLFQSTSRYQADQAKIVAVAFALITAAVWTILSSRARSRRLANLGFKSFYRSELTKGGRRKAIENRRRLLSWHDNGFLHGAYVHPNHSAEGRTDIANELSRRGQTAQTSADALLPSTFEALKIRRSAFGSVSSLNLQAMLRSLQFRVLQIIAMPAMIVAAPLIVFGLLAKLSLLQPRDSFRSYGQEQFWWYFDPAQDTVLFIMFALIAAIVLLVWLLAILGRKQVPRILLLRPFGAIEMTTPLRKLVVSDIGRVGDVVTLSDRGYKPDVFMRVVRGLMAFFEYIYAPLAKPSFRIAAVRGEASFSALADSVFAGAGMRRCTIMSAGQAVNVATTDDWWKNVVNLLMTSTDAIIVDLTRVGPGTEWELVQIEKRGLLEKCVFIVGDSELDTATRLLADRFADISPRRIYSYDARGKATNGAELREAMKNAVLTGSRAIVGARAPRS